MSLAKMTFPDRVALEARTPKVLADTEGGLYLTPRDPAKFGCLYLKDGKAVNSSSCFRGSI
jgi:CubicO group peptidase (beta-lactamase class C family)